MGIRSTDFGAMLIEQKVRLGNERVFPDRFPAQDPTTVGTPPSAVSAGVGGAPSTPVLNADKVGYSVSVNGDLAAVGVPLADYDIAGSTLTTDTGLVYIYKRTEAAGWTFAYKISAEAAGGGRQASAQFGFAVSLFGGILAVGSPYHTLDSNGTTAAAGAGSVYLYEVSDTAALFKQRLSAPPNNTNARVANDNFGYSVSVMQDVVAVGAPFQDYDEQGTVGVTDAGAVYLFIRNQDTKLWQYAQKVIAQGNSRNVSDLFGSSTASDGNLLVVGAPGYDYSSTPGLGYTQDSGAAYIFYWDSTASNWVYETTIIPATRTASDRFGDRVALSGTAVAISSGTSSVGRVRVYRRQKVGVWVEEASFVPLTRIVGVGSPRFGLSLSFNKNTLVVGAPYQNMSSGTGGFSSTAVGNVYVYVYANSTWTLQQDFSVPTLAVVPANNYTSENFGFAVSVSDDVLVVGAPGDDYDQSTDGTRYFTNGLTDAGAAFVYTRTNNVWSFQQKLVGWGQDRNANDNLGITMAYSNGTLVASSYGHCYDVNGNNYMASAGAIYVWVSDGTQLVFKQKITPTGNNARVTSDQFGKSLAIDGDTIVAGTDAHIYNATGNGGVTGAGALWVFKRINDVFVQQQKLVSPAQTTNEYFGRSLVIQGTTIVASAVGCTTDAAGANSISGAGAVYVFDLNTTTGVWSNTAKIVQQGPGGRLANDQFGFSLDYKDNMLLVGSPNHNLDFDGANPLTGTGAAWLYTRTGTTWNYVTKFSGWGQDRNANDFMGIAMAASGDTIAVGVSNHSYDATSRNFVSNAGAVLVYTWNNSAWVFQAKLTSEGNRSTNGKFGRSLSMDGDTLVVGAPGEEIPTGGNFGTNETYWGNGATYVFVRTFGVWTRQARLLPTGTNANYNNGLRSNNSHNRFGWSVSVNGNLLLVGQPWASYDNTGTTLIDNAGAAFVFVRNPTTNTWSQEGRLTANMIVATDRLANDNFGYSVSLRDGIAVVGTPYQDNDQNGLNALSNAGAAYVFRRDLDGQGGFVWVGEQKLIAWGQDRNTNDQLSASIAGHNGTLVVGAPNHSYDLAGASYLASAGAAYVWVLQDNVWQFQQKLIATGANNRNLSDRFGTSVSISGDNLVVGSPYHKYFTDGTLYSPGVGAAWVFSRSGGRWSQVAKLGVPLAVKTDLANRGVSTNFATTLKMDNDTLVAGAPLYHYDANNANVTGNAGAVFVFRLTNSVWAQETVLTAGVRRSNENFGSSLDLRDNLIMVGSIVSSTDTSEQSSTLTYSGSGGVWIFKRSGTTWSTPQKLSSAPMERNPEDQFGFAVVSDGTTLAVGAPYHSLDSTGDNTLTNAGAVYVYRFTAGSWRFETKLTPTGLNARNSSAQFGYSLSVSNDTIAVGAPNSIYDSTGANSISAAGAVFVYRGTPAATVRKTRRRAFFTGSGANNSFLVPDGITSLNVLMWGAAGGGSGYSAGYGGAGGFTKARVAVQGGDSLTVRVGVGGSVANFVGSGGGRTELLRGSTTLAVAAGGGGAGNSNTTYLTTNGGAGGGVTGEDTPDADVNGGGGRGGSFTGGGRGGYTTGIYQGGAGSKLQGGDGYGVQGVTYTVVPGGWPNGGRATYAASWANAGGGDGWYGGGASSSPFGIATGTSVSAGAGGSGYIHPDATGYTLRSTNHLAPDVKRLGTMYSFLTPGNAVAGGAGNNGLVMIEWEEPYNPRTWSQEARITPTGTNARVANDKFGFNVSLQGDSMVVGASGHSYDAAGANLASSAGAAWVFDRTGAVWSQTIKLVGYGLNGRAANDQFGFSVALYGDIIAIGAPSHATDETGANAQSTAGATFTFRKSNNTWSALSKLVGYGRDVDSTNNSGFALSGDGIYLASGAPGFDYDNSLTNFISDSGAVYMWVWNGSLWALEQRLVAPPQYRNTNARFGYSVYLRDDTVVVGALGANTNGKIAAGAAFVFRRTNLDATAPWTLEASIEAPTANAIANGAFGTSVVYYKDTVAISSPASQIISGSVTDGAGGAVFVFARTGTTWAFQQRLVPTGVNASLAGDQFGYSLSLVDDMLVVGAPTHSWDVDGRNSQSSSGAAWVFTRAAGVWSQNQKLMAWGHDRNDGDRLGIANAANGNTLAVSATYHSFNDSGTEYLLNAGAVYVWVWEGNPAAWRLQQKITPTGLNARAAGDFFGTSLALNGDLLAVGVPAHSTDAVGANTVSSSGAVFVYRRNGNTPGTKVWSQEAKIVPTGTNSRTANSRFGFSVAVEDSSGTLIVGSPYHTFDDGGANPLTDAGAAWYFRKEDTSWNQKQKIIASGINRGTTSGNARLASDQFAYSVDVRSDILVIGAPFHDYDQNGRNILTDSGAVFLMSRNPQSGLWEQKQKLVGWGQDRNANDQYGFSVAGDGNYLAVSAINHSYDSKNDFYVPNAGAVYMWSFADGAWNFQQKITAAEGASNAPNVVYGAHRYWQMANIVPDGNTEAWSLFELEFYDASGTKLAYTATQSNPYNLSLHPTANLYDGILTGNKLGAGKPTGDTLTIDFGSAKAPASIRFYTRESPYVNQTPRSYDLRYSDDNTTYVNTGEVNTFSRLNLTTLTVTTWYTHTWPTSSNAVANNRVTGDQFGYAMSMSDGYLAVSAPYQDYDTIGGNSLANAGAVYMFKLTSGLWSFNQKIVPTGTNARNANDQFGLAVSLDSDTLAVGAPLHDYDESGVNVLADAGAVWVYRRDSSSVWSQERKLAGSGTNSRVASDQFGSSVALKGNLLVAGVPYQDYDQDGRNLLADSGVVYVFRRTGTTWAFEDKLSPTGEERRVGDNLSASTDVWGDWMILGAPNHDYDRYNRVNLNDAGAAYVFQWLNGAWQYDGKITPSGTNARNISDLFGSSVAIWNGQVAVGAPAHGYDATGGSLAASAGAVWTFKRNPQGLWIQTAKLVPQDTGARAAGDQFGAVLSMMDGNLAVGVPNHTMDALGANPLANAGAVFMYALSTIADVEAWRPTTKIVPTGVNARNAGDRFGAAVSVDTVAMVIGAPGHAYDVYGSSGSGQGGRFELPITGAGAAWLFKLVDSAWVQSNKLTAFGSTRRAGDHFGAGISAAGSSLLVSAADHALDQYGAAPVASAGALYAYNKRTATRDNFLRLNGSTDFADISTVMLAINNRAYTIAGWFRTTDGTIGRTSTLWSMSEIVNGTVVQKHRLELVNGSLRFFNNITGVTVNYDPVTNDGAWHHIAVSLDTSGNFNIYLDGGVIHTFNTDYSSVVGKTEWKFLVGARVATAVNPTTFTAGLMYQGDVSDFAVWNLTLAPADIRAIATGTNTVANTAPSSLYGYWIKN